MIRLIEQLKIDEGVKLMPYVCSAGKLTIGIGRNIEDIGISEEEAEIMLINDIDRVIRELSSEFEFYESLSQVRREALINMGFNLGFSRLLTFKKMILALGRGDYIKASDEMLDSRWSKQVGDRAKRLAYMMRHDAYYD